MLMNQKSCHFPRIASLIASTYCAGTQYIQYLEASVGPNCKATIWYSLWPSIGSLTTFLMEFNGSFSVRSFVPINEWKNGYSEECSLLNVKFEGEWVSTFSTKLLIEGTINTVIATYRSILGHFLA